MLFAPTPPPNPYHPFVWRNGEVRHTGDLGDRYEADVWETRAGWRWSARASTAGDPADGIGETADPTWETITPTDPMPGGEEDAMAAATEWLRSRVVAMHGSCG